VRGSRIGTFGGLTPFPLWWVGSCWHWKMHLSESQLKDLPRRAQAMLLPWLRPFLTVAQYLLYIHT
jgi:hypothetical protein